MVNSVGAFTSPNVTDLPFSAGTAVANTDSHTPSGQNQETYIRLKAALGLNLRRQVFVAVCDDLILRDRIAHQLQVDLGGLFNPAQIPQPESSPQIARYSRLVSLNLDIQNPNPIIQISHWLAKFPPPQQGGVRMPMPAFQILGIELLSRQPASVQWLFLTYLQGIERSLPALESSILFWMPRPWVRIIPQSAPEFWHCRTALFDFVGEPTPVARQKPQQLSSTAPSHQPRSPRQPVAPRQPLTAPSPAAAVPPPPPSLSISSQRDRLPAAPSNSLSAEPQTQTPLSSKATSQSNPLSPSESSPSRSTPAPSANHPSNSQSQSGKPSDRQPSAAITPLPTSSDMGVSKPVEPARASSPPVADSQLPTPNSQARLPDPSGDRVARPISPPLPSNETVGSPVRSFSANRPSRNAVSAARVSDAIYLTGQSHEPISLSDIEADVAEFDEIDFAPSESERAPSPMSAPPPEPTRSFVSSDTPDETLSLPPQAASSVPVTSVPPSRTDRTAGSRVNVNINRANANSAHSDSPDSLEIAPTDSSQVQAASASGESLPITEIDPVDAGLNLEYDWDGGEMDITAVDVVSSRFNISQEIEADELDFTGYSPPPAAADAAPMGTPLSSGSANEPDILDELDLNELDIVDAEPDFLDWSLQGSVKATQEAATSDRLANRSDPGDADLHRQDMPSDPQAQSFLNQIEQLHRRRAEPMVLAHAYRALGNLYRDRIEQGNASPQTLMAAMSAYEQVLRWLDDGSPLWAEVLNDMGNLCWLLSRSSPSPDQGLPYLQQGIQFYQVALTKISPQTHPQTYPMIQNNLGAAHGDLARYQDPVENLQRSTQAYQEALRYRKAEDDPMRYASTQNNLGTTYWNLAQHHEPRVYLKQAIASYAEALRYYRPEQEPLNYAMIQNNLGTAYWNLAQYDQPQDWLALALGAYRMALKYRTMEQAPLAFAATQNNLGTAYWHMATHTNDNPETKRDYLERAIAAYDSALTAVHQLSSAAGGPVPLNFDVLATHNNLGLVHYELVNDAHITLVGTNWSDCLKASLKNHIVAFQGWQHRLELRQTALQCIIQTVRAFFNKGGLEGQNIALSLLPGSLLPEILPKL